MAVTHSNTAKVSIGNAVLDDIDVAAAGVLKLMNTGKTATYATLTLADPAGTVNATTGVLTFTASATTPLSDTNTSAGTATRAKITTSAGATILDDIVVGTSTTDEIELSNNVFGAGDTVNITALTYTPPT